MVEPQADAHAGVDAVATKLSAGLGKEMENARLKSSATKKSEETGRKNTDPFRDAERATPQASSYFSQQSCILAGGA